VPYGNLNVKPMNPKTKDKVKNLRRIQLFLRLCALLGALGMLFCVISINKTSSSVGWIIRVMPAVALLHTLYAVYHLCRAVTGRTPASTASYMLFAATVDAGLIPFLAFSALIAHADYTNNAYGWSTLFGTDKISYDIIYSFFLICVVEGSLIIVSLVLGIYLGILFRKIAKMPPDMNPLEPNLTARPNHKRSKSEMTNEKRLSGSNASSKNRLSNSADPMIAGTRRAPFLHTRTDSADSITLYGNESARNSKAALEEKEERQYRKSQLSQEVNGVSRPDTAINPSEKSRTAGSGHDETSHRSSLTPQQRNTKTSSWLSWATADPESQPRAVSGYAALMLDHDVPAPLPVSQHPSRHQTPDIVLAEKKNWYERSAKNSQTYLPIEQRATPPPSNLQLPPLHQAKKRSREPLGMNPPTPPIQQYQDENEDMYGNSSASHQSLVNEPHRRSLQDTNVNTVATPRDNPRPSAFVGSGGKSRFYGSLRRSISSLSPRDLEVQRDDVSDAVSDYSRTRTMESEYSHIEVFGVDDDDNKANDRTHQEQVRSITSEQWNDGRQVSNSTGYDLHAGYAGLGAEFGRGMGRRREVSGKVAEEGRGYGGFGAAEKEAGATKGQEQRGGAAGWARFKGM